MSGYLGNPDAESEHALILAENGINTARQSLIGPVVRECVDCGLPINPQRIEALRSLNMKCLFCLNCQHRHDKQIHVKMLDRVL